ncbi:hypothetical protein AX774_g2386 [Zancudomyces culisetae]|uniref:Uncharacterized protein n=1 Tax=Zancudomyces culisetae TaxID=1213189 RepID=A0A1R1PT03_ZANCU|nr:hypothetical protein AX774_g2386 [Zancudomyces culisetae]|eukprot:OMH84098.1 hypothetical protein AX774_g2386 [Zancudomyces culisetae]
MKLKRSNFGEMGPRARKSNRNTLESYVSDGFEPTVSKHNASYNGVRILDQLENALKPTCISVGFELDNRENGDTDSDPDPECSFLTEYSHSNHNCINYPCATANEITTQSCMGSQSQYTNCDDIAISCSPDRAFKSNAYSQMSTISGYSSTSFPPGVWATELSTFEESPHVGLELDEPFLGTTQESRTDVSDSTAPIRNNTENSCNITEFLQTQHNIHEDTCISNIETPLILDGTLCIEVEEQPDNTDSGNQCNRPSQIKTALSPATSVSLSSNSTIEPCAPGTERKYPQFFLQYTSTIAEKKPDHFISPVFNDTLSPGLKKNLDADTTLSICEKQNLWPYHSQHTDTQFDKVLIGFLEKHINSQEKNCEARRIGSPQKDSGILTAVLPSPKIAQNNSTFNSTKASIPENMNSRKYLDEFVHPDATNTQKPRFTTPRDRIPHYEIFSDFKEADNTSFQPSNVNTSTQELSLIPTCTQRTRSSLSSNTSHVFTPKNAQVRPNICLYSGEIKNAQSLQLSNVIPESPLYEYHNNNTNRETPLCSGFLDGLISPVKPLSNIGVADTTNQCIQTGLTVSSTTSISSINSTPSIVRMTPQPRPGGIVIPETVFFPRASTANSSTITTFTSISRPSNINTTGVLNTASGTPRTSLPKMNFHSATKPLGDRASVLPNDNSQRKHYENVSFLGKRHRSTAEVQKSSHKHLLSSTVDLRYVTPTKRSYMHLNTNPDLNPNSSLNPESVTNHICTDSVHVDSVISVLETPINLL